MLLEQAVHVLHGGTAPAGDSLAAATVDDLRVPPLTRRHGRDDRIESPEVGDGANIGAGAVTCNFDGEQKHRTEIGEGAFIGSDTMLVAPVRVGAGATTGAGSVITRDVPDGALAVERSPQRTVPGWAEHRSRRNKKASD